MTTTFKRALQLSAALPILMLAGCGEGYEMVPYHGTPYDGDRTAGSGVEYVLASMLPAKGVVEEAAPAAVETPAAEAPAEQISAPPAEATVAPVAEPEAEPAKGDKVFHDKQVK